MSAPNFDHGPFDPDELVRWAENYGHPEGWAKKAQALHGENEALRDRAVSAQHAEAWEAALRLAMSSEAVERMAEWLFDRITQERQTFGAPGLGEGWASAPYWIKRSWLEAAEEALAFAFSSRAECEDKSGGFQGSESHVTGRNLDGPMG